MQSTITQGNDGLFILDLEADPAESGYEAIDPGLYYVDQDSGQVYTREAIDGDADDDGSWTAQGKLLPFVGDQAAPNTPTGLAVTAVDTVEDADGSVLTGFEVEWNTSPEDDIIGYHLEYDAQVYNFSTESYDAATFAQPIVRNYGVFGNPPKEGPYLVRGEFIGGTPYDFRVSALDAEGFASAWSSIVTETALKDGTAPEVPTNPEATPGFRLLGVKWDKNEEADLWFYQVRYYKTSDGVEQAKTIRTFSTLVIIKDLDPDEEYTFEVRAVDRSGNVATSESDLTGVQFSEDDSAGWSEAATGTPTKIGAADVAFNSVLTSILSANAIDADDIKSGTLTVGKTGFAGSIELYNAAGVLLATLDTDGLVMFDPNDSTHAMWLKAGSLKFTTNFDTDVDTTETNGDWTAAVTPDGINATAITFGTGRGGANSIPNAGFELAAFAVISTATWNTSAGTPSWDDATSTVNLDTSNAYLTMTGT